MFTLCTHLSLLCCVPCAPGPCAPTACPNPARSRAPSVSPSAALSRRLRADPNDPGPGAATLRGGLLHDSSSARSSRGWPRGRCKANHTVCGGVGGRAAVSSFKLRKMQGQPHCVGGGGWASSGELFQVDRQKKNWRRLARLPSGMWRVLF